MSIYNLVSFLGIFVLMGFAWLLSRDRGNMNWRVILWGTAIQLAFAFLLFQFELGNRIFSFVNDAVVEVIDASSFGAKFVFGRLAYPPGTTDEQGQPSLGFILAFQAFPTIVFFSALMSVLYYARIMPLLIRGFAWLFTRLMRLSGAESLCAASNIFVGIEANLTVKPHLAAMTKSELCTVLTAGMATVASNVLALYVFTLRGQFQGIAGHLVSASILGAPAALVMSKILWPESENPETLGRTIEPHYEREGSLFEAVINGANDGLKLIGGIVALLLAVLGLVALTDLVLTWVGIKINMWCGLSVDWSLRGLLGYLFYPFTVVIGVPVQDAGVISRIIGERMVLTEVTSYGDLATALANGALTDPKRSAVVATYALCGFAHLASMAIFVGGTAALAPGQTRNLARMGFRALLAATLACLMIACVAGTFYTGQTALWGAK